MIAEKSLGGDPFRIQDIHERYGILGETCCEDDDLKVFTDFKNEFTAVRSDLDVDVAGAALDINWKDNICLISWTEARVNQSLINVEKQCLAAT